MHDVINADTYFQIVAVRTKAGYIGQVVFAGRIIWESEVFPEGQETEEVMVDKLSRRVNEVDSAQRKATESARSKVFEVMENLFSGKGL